MGPHDAVPILVALKPSRAPLLGEPLDLTLVGTATRDLDQVEIWVSAGIQNEMGGRTTVPLEDLLVDGGFTWQGSMKHGEPVVLTGTLVFPREGDWSITSWAQPNLGFTQNMRGRIFLHVGIEDSRYGWNVSHHPIFNLPPK